MLSLLKEGDPLQTRLLCAFRRTESDPLIRACPLLPETDPLLSPTQKSELAPILSSNKTPF